MLCSFMKFTINPDIVQLAEVSSPWLVICMYVL